MEMGLEQFLLVRLNENIEVIDGHADNIRDVKHCSRC